MLRLRFDAHPDAGRTRVDVYVILTAVFADVDADVDRVGSRNRRDLGEADRGGFGRQAIPRAGRCVDYDPDESREQHIRHHDAAARVILNLERRGAVAFLLKPERVAVLGLEVERGRRGVLAGFGRGGEVRARGAGLDLNRLAAAAEHETADGERRDERDGGDDAGEARSHTASLCCGLGRLWVGCDSQRSCTLYPPSLSSRLERATIERSSPCSNVFTRPRSTGPCADPFPFPVMMCTMAPGLRRRHESRNARTADGVSIAP